MRFLKYILLISITCLVYSCNEDNPEGGINFFIDGVKDLSASAPGSVENLLNVDASLSGESSLPEGDVYLRVVDVPDNVFYSFSENAREFPFQTTLQFVAESDAIEGDYVLKVEGSYSQDFDEVVSESFTLTISKESSNNSNECGDYLEGQYSGPDTCAPQGFGDVAVDLVYITDGDTIKLNHEFYSTDIVAILDCDNETFTVPSQNVTVTGGAQSGTISGEGSIEISTDTSVIFIYTTVIQSNSLTCRADLEK